MPIILTSEKNVLFGSVVLLLILIFFSGGGVWFTHSCLGFTVVMLCSTLNCCGLKSLISALT